MTVKEAAAVFKRADSIKLAYDGNAVQFDKDDVLMADAYGKYIVDEIVATDEGRFEIAIAMRPMKAGDC